MSDETNALSTQLDPKSCPHCGRCLGCGGPRPVVYPSWPTYYPYYPAPYQTWPTYPTYPSNPTYTYPVYYSPAPAMTVTYTNSSYFNGWTYGESALPESPAEDA